MGELYNVSFTKEEIEYILEAFDIFPTINAYGGDAVRIEDSINAKLGAALNRSEDTSFNLGSGDPSDYTLEDEVGVGSDEE